MSRPIIVRRMAKAAKDDDQCILFARGSAARAGYGSGRRIESVEVLNVVPCPASELDAVMCE
jgi:hypothetical protein